jgi:hypothetical protein
MPKGRAAQAGERAAGAYTAALVVMILIANRKFPSHSNELDAGWSAKGIWGEGGLVFFVGVGLFF